jgi:hypothetical protein
MSKRCALINLASGLVENLIVADPATDVVDAGYLLIESPPDGVVIGATWDGAKFTNSAVAAPGSPAPTSVAPAINGVNTI